MNREVVVESGGGSLALNDVHCGDCLELMKAIPSGSVDMILCDPPYGTTACSWDTVLDMDSLWQQYSRLIKPTGAIVITASQPFTTDVILGKREWFKYTLVWAKTDPTGFVHAKNKPLKEHEDILVFSPGTTVHASQSSSRMTYNPQGTSASGAAQNGKRKFGTIIASRPSHVDTYIQEAKNYPRSILKFASESETIHPTQKPVALFEYLILTYTNEGDLVLDNTAGSGTTGVACKKSNRNFILIEQDPKFCEIAKRRISEVHPSLFGGID